MTAHWSFIVRVKIYLAFWICFFSEQSLFGGVEREEKREKFKVSRIIYVEVFTKNSTDLWLFFI